MLGKPPPELELHVLLHEADHMVPHRQAGAQEDEPCRQLLSKAPALDATCQSQLARLTSLVGIIGVVTCMGLLISIARGLKAR